MNIKHLLVVAALIGSSAAMAFCPSGPNYWACWENEMQQQRQQQQMRDMQEQQQRILDQQRQQQTQQQRQGQPLQCFKDSWGNIKCYQ